MRIIFDVNAGSTEGTTRTTFAPSVLRVEPKTYQGISNLQEAFVIAQKVWG
jgi:hypothetical protein